MILSNVEIHKALDAGDIIIEPQPTPRFASLAQPKSPYDTTAVNLRLSPHLSVCKQPSPMTFDLRKSGLPALLDKVYEPYDMDKAGGYSLKPGTFVLGNTAEVVTLPIRKKRPVYAARIEGRSSFARCGLLIHFTAPTIHAGFEGTITFEIMNFGLHDITLYPDLEVGQLVFERVLGFPKPNNSQYQGQRKPSGAKSKSAPESRSTRRR
jgi:dCTP deaminase